MIDYSVCDGICLLRVNAPPLNTINFALLDALREAVERANADPQVRGIILTGSEDHFSAGADVNLFRGIRTAEDAIRMSRVYQEAFQQVEDSPRPVVAALAGKVLGCALELAAACRWRVCTEQTTFQSPEVNLGINPGAGGTQRLPRLIGPQAALRMMIKAEPLAAQAALALGLVDDVCPREGLLARARQIVQSSPLPPKVCRRTDKLGDAAALGAVLREAEALLAKSRPELIAPRNILEAVRAGLEAHVGAAVVLPPRVGRDMEVAVQLPPQQEEESFAAGLQAEQRAFAECMATLATQNKIHIFFATRQTSKVPGMESLHPRSIGRAAVVGCGSMGAGIVQTLITAGIPVAVREQNPSALQKGIETIRGSLEKRIEQGRLRGRSLDSLLELVRPAERWEELGGADLVIEAVYEELAAKREVLRRLEEVCPPETILASNTSTISLDALAAGLQRPERLIGLHFFYPAHHMPLVEVIRRRCTPPETVAAALKLAKAIGKTPVVVNNREGFLVNRIFVPYLKEAFWLLEEGAAPEAIDRAMVEFGFPMGPLALCDMTGLDILVATDRVLHRAFPRHGPLSPVAVGLVEQGLLGQKAGRGVYGYASGDRTPRPSEATARLVAQLQQQQGRRAQTVASEKISERLVLRMVNEAFYVLEEAVAQREADVDAAMVLGTGFPDFRGGLLKYARDVGLDRVLARLEGLAAQLGPRYAPCELLRKSVGYASA